MATKTNATVKNVTVGVQSGTDRTCYATWDWSKDHTDYYLVKWAYTTGDGVLFKEVNQQTTYRQDVYNAPSNAKKVKVKIKPVAKKHTVTKTVNGKKKSTEEAYWTADWSTYKEYTFPTQLPTPETPSAPTLTLDGSRLTATVNITDSNTKHLEFEFVQNNTSLVKKGMYYNVQYGYAAYMITVSTGQEYKVRVRAYSNDQLRVSDWSSYSSSCQTPPSGVTNVTVSALTATSVMVSWDALANATSYKVEWSNYRMWFDSNPDGVKSRTVPASTPFTEITGLGTDEEGNATWYFRVQAINDGGGSVWSTPVGVTVGKPPAAPTTWSSVSSAVSGADVYLYWVHNSEDGSALTSSQIELTINGTTTTITVQGSSNPDLRDRIQSYSVSTSSYIEGTVINWRVRTKGAYEDYGDWSVSRVITVYGAATLAFNQSIPSVLTSFPLVVSVTASPSSQTALQFFVSIVANESYETLDFDGSEKLINAGEEIYSANLSGSGNSLNLSILPSDVNLDNNISYTLNVMASMNSGLSAENSADFTVGWEDEYLEPNAEIAIDDDYLVAYITPYCVDDEETEVSNVTLSVYRIEYDGVFKEIATGIPGGRITTITDPHPALDYARYRIVAISNVTGAIGYADLYEFVGEYAAIIQWDEKWKNYASDVDEDMNINPWGGSMLRLPFNLDVSDSNDQDVAFINYVGRKHPVSYYGTQLGHTATWNMDIDAEDKETLYQLRRLGAYSGNVYVREPSGSGYWANMKVSFSQKHLDVVIPVTLTMTRVEGGV